MFFQEVLIAGGQCPPYGTYRGLRLVGNAPPYALVAVGAGTGAYAR